MEYVIVITVIAIVIGTIFGDQLRWKVKTKKAQKETSLMSAKDLREHMVQAHYDRNSLAERTTATEATWLENSLNKIIKKQAEQGSTELIVRMSNERVADNKSEIVQVGDAVTYTLGKKTGDKKTELELATELERWEHGMEVLRKVGDYYCEAGYTVSVDMDSNWKGTFVEMSIRWDTDGFDGKDCKKIKYDSQVDAFKQGVPLSDIVA